MQSHLHSWYTDYIVSRRCHRTEPVMVVPLVQPELVPVLPGCCPRTLFAVCQRADRIYGELVETVNAELETGYTTQCYYTWIEDVRDFLARPVIPWYLFDSRADVLRGELRRSSGYESYSHEYQITSKIIGLLRSCGRACKAVCLLENETLCSRKIKS